MAGSDGTTATFQVNSGALATGVILAAAGSLLGLAGAAICFGSLASATRRWANQLETPPSQLARQHLARARVATVAGAKAWRNGGTPVSAG
jgi:hypothetical protein